MCFPNGRKSSQLHYYRIPALTPNRGSKGEKIGKSFGLPANKVFFSMTEWLKLLNSFSGMVVNIISAS